MCMRPPLPLPRPFRVVIVVSALVYGSHALYDAFAVIRWSAAGLSAPATSFRPVWRQRPRRFTPSAPVS